MQIIHKEELKDLCPKIIAKNECFHYTCTYNNQKYFYKELFPDNNIVKLYNSLESINNPSFLIPKILVFKNRITGDLTQELIDYASLSDLKDKDYNEKIRILKLIKEKIIMMHEYGIIHRDLHASNIMCKNNDIKIIDFESCSYKGNTPSVCNKYSKNYLKENKLSPSVDIYNFNIDTASVLYNINWLDIFNYSFTFEDKLTPLQSKVWVKTKEKKELTSNDYLIDYY